MLSFTRRHAAALTVQYVARCCSVARQFVFLGGVRIEVKTLHPPNAHA